jgi:hypothetical protein
MTTDVRALGLAEQTLPRLNGAPVFDAPWQARVHVMAVLAVESLGCEWDEFRRHLVTAVADDADRPYWDSWVVALEAFLGEHDLLDHP